MRAQHKQRGYFRLILTVRSLPPPLRIRFSFWPFPRVFVVLHGVSAAATVGCSLFLLFRLSLGIGLDWIRSQLLLLPHLRDLRVLQVLGVLEEMVSRRLRGE